MTETYTVVGHEMDWLLACMPLAGLLGVWLRNRAVTPRQWRWYALVFGYFISAAVLGLPFEWAVSSLALCGAISMIFGKASIERYRHVKAFAMLMVCAASIYLGLRPEDRLVMRTNSLDFYSSGKKESTPRSGLGIDERRVKGWEDIRSKAWWHTRSGKDYGPEINGSDLYWGPQGLMRGDDVGLKLAEWAYVKPQARE